MLKFLSITNLAVIQRLSFELHAGLNLLTGETGAGKSILVDALGLLLGGRGGAEIVRTGERSAVVEGIFDLAGEREQRIRTALSEIGINKESEEELSIRREVQAGGRSRIFINDKSVTAATLKSLQPLLVEIHGQGEQYLLSNARAQLEILDEFANCTETRTEVARLYARWRRAVEALQSLERDEAARERACDMLRFQIAEIERANPQPSEDEELSAERKLLAHAERALELSHGAYSALYESDQSALSQLASARRRLQDLSSIDPRVEALLEGIEAAGVALTDVSEFLREYGVGLDFSPARLAEIESRLAELERLRRKYGRDMAGLLEVRDDLREQLLRMENLEVREKELAGEVEEAARAYEPVARILSERRRAAAAQFEQRMTEELRFVALERARFSVALVTATPETHTPLVPLEAARPAPEAESGSHSFWSPSGADRVEFLFSANVGEMVRPLSRIASGGELSRLMLTLRTVCRERRAERSAGEASGATLVFDEIDTGIGGRVAETVGRRLLALSESQQVICVTHQPQIARFADHHYTVSKRVEAGRTVTNVQELQPAERIGELARMIGGAETLEVARETARWMLESAREEPSAEAGATLPASRKGSTRTRKRAKG